MGLGPYNHRAVLDLLRRRAGKDTLIVQISVFQRGSGKKSETNPLDFHDITPATKLEFVENPLRRFEDGIFIKEVD
jgi:hypothetical protein